MNRLLSVAIDRFGIYKKNKLRSPHSQYAGLTFSSMDQTAITKMVQQQTPPLITFVDETNSDGLHTCRFSFTSRIPDNGDSNAICCGEYHQNPIESAVDVIVVHGWKSSSLKSVKKMLLAPLLAEGHNVFFMELPHHLNRKMTDSGFSGEYMISADVGRTILSVQQAVLDAADLVAWSEAKNHKTAVIGASLGGLVTNLLGCTETRMDALVSIMYASNTAHLIWKSDIAKYIKQDLVQAGFPFEKLQEKWEVIDPSRYQPILKKDKILLISGQYDEFITSEDSQRLWASWGKPERIVLPCGHSGMNVSPKPISDIVCRFLRKAL